MGVLRTWTVSLEVPLRYRYRPEGGAVYGCLFNLRGERTSVKDFSVLDEKIPGVVLRAESEALHYYWMIP
jgi:hypothetical protein